MIHLTEPHFLGSEAPTHPDLDHLVDVTREVVGERAPDRGLVSMRTGHRMAVSGPGSGLGELTADGFLEVVDYDAHHDRLLLYGQGEPDPLAAVHHLVYRARQEVQSILQVEVPADHPAHGRLPRASPGTTHVETALDVLRNLREGEAVSLADRWVLAVGETPQAARQVLDGALGDRGDDAPGDRAGSAPGDVREA